MAYCAGKKSDIIQQKRQIIATIETAFPLMI